MSERLHQFCTTLKCPALDNLYTSITASSSDTPTGYRGILFVKNDNVPWREEVLDLECWLKDQLVELGINDSLIVRLDAITPELANFAVFVHPERAPLIGMLEGLTGYLDIDA